MRYVKNFLFFCGFLLGVIVLILLLRDPLGKRTGRFTVSAIQFQRDQDVLQPLSYPEEVLSLFDKKLVYLGSGTQFCVFSSEGSNYVIKFLKKGTFPDPCWSFALPYIPFISQIEKRRLLQQEARKKRVLKACSLAYENVTSRSHILYMQLTEGPLLKEITLVDKIGRSYQINLAKTRFVIQEKAVCFDKAFTSLTSWQEQGRVVDSLIKIITDRCKKGVTNRDPDLFRNFGIIRGEVVEIDFGDFLEDSSVKTVSGYQVELIRYIKTLFTLAAKVNPSLCPYIEKEYQEAVASFESRKQEEKKIFSTM